MFHFGLGEEEREAKKIEAPLAHTHSSPSFGELNQLRLVLVQLQTESLQSCFECLENLVCFLPVPAADHQIVAVPMHGN